MAQSEILTEAYTRHYLLDRLLIQAGWVRDRRSLLPEFFLDFQIKPEGKTEADEGRRELADYVLIDNRDKPIAIVETKCSSRDAQDGKRKAAGYAKIICDKYGVDPFIFLTDGGAIWFWDRQVSDPYQVSGFFTQSDLERLAFLRQYRSSHINLGPSPKIVDRAYQQQAVRSVIEAIEQGQRHFLLVMATGTGKTRTVIALIDLLMRERWIQRVLFLVDRRELARQALSDFKEHMPNESRARIEAGHINDKARIHVATYPSMMQVYRQLSPGYYDFIIADESHRSIYNRYKALLDHFAGMQLGITATPTDYIDHNTFELFKCPDGLPTFYYSYETAVEEGYLAQYRVLEAKTNFQLEGIKAGQLPLEIQRQLEEQGIDLSELNFEGSDLERRVTNTGTNDAIVQEFFTNCRKDASGIVPAKTIIFAMNHRHAVELKDSFRRMRPDLYRLGLVEVIDSHIERADKLLDDFKYKDMPRVAISVDMLDTGIDVPLIQNLVFAKPVFSYVKFWQMIGRGTRLWEDKRTGKKKNSFLIIDHWNNFACFNINPESEIVSSTEPLPVRLFRLLLRNLDHLRSNDATEYIEVVVKQLQSMLEAVPIDHINVRPHLLELSELKRAESWLQIDSHRSDHISKTIAPLTRLIAKVNLSVMTFELHTEQLALAYLEKNIEEIEKKRVQITDDLRLLPSSLPQVQACADQLAWMTSDGFWEHLDYRRIMDLQSILAPLMEYRQPRRRDIIKLNLPDRIVSRRWIIYGPSGEGAFAESYREQVEAHVRRLADQLPALDKLKRGERLSDSELHTLSESLNEPDLFITEDKLKEVYERPDTDLHSLLRHILGFEKLESRQQQIVEIFDKFIQNNPRLTATQISFLRTIRAAMIRGARLKREDLGRPPFSRVGDVQILFTEDEQNEVLNLANRVVA
jgi:type I restriction enzyme, R subunit